MKRFNQIFIIKFFSIVFVFLFACKTNNQSTDNLITKEYAIKLAEQFVIDNGYTTFSANKAALRFELFDNTKHGVDKILNRRFNTLYPKAFFIIEDKEMWHIGFLSSKIDLSKLDSNDFQTNLSGRAVVVMKKGKEIRIAHKEPLFSNFQKL